MRDSVVAAEAGIAPQIAAGCRVLDRGRGAPSRSALASVVGAVVTGALPEVARDRNAICHRALLAGRGGIAHPVIVKSPRLGEQRTNPDATFAGEARILAQLPVLGINAAPRLIARVVAGDAHFLFVSEVPGKHPHSQKHPLDLAQLRAIVEALLAMDRIGFMHYDLKAANMLTDGACASFIDYEFACVGAPWNAAPPEGAAFGRDFNAANNPFVCARSNVANFEFRCLHRYLAELEEIAPDAAALLLRAWLSAKAPYHAAMARGLSDRAAAHERRLARLFADPPRPVIRVERALMAFRTAVFERDRRNAARSRRTIRTAIAQHRSRAADVPRWYAAAVARVVDLVARSVHPTP